MRSLLLLLFIVAAPAIAQEPVVDSCAVDAAISCPVEVVLPGFAMVDGDPVVTGADRLTFVALDRDEPQQAFAVDLSLSNGRILRTLPLQLSGDKSLSFDWLIAPGGQGYLLFVWENKQDRVLVFFDAAGVPRSRMPEVRPQGWPYELTMARALMFLGRQNILAFDGQALHGRVGRFDLRLTAADGRLNVVRRDAGTASEDRFEDDLSRRLDPEIALPGAELAHVEGQLSAVTTRESAGAPSRFFLRTAEGDEVALDASSEPTVTDDRAYGTARLSPDHRFVAVTRYDGKQTPKRRLLIFDTTTKALVYQAAVRPCWSNGLRWLGDGRIVRLCFRMRDGIDVVVLDPRLPRQVP